MVDRKIRIEVAFPVIPESPRIVLERRHADLWLVEQFLRGRAVEARRIIHELQHGPGNLQVAQDLVEDVLDRLAALDRLHDRFRCHRQHLRIEPERHLGRVRGTREDIQHFADASHLGVGQVETFAVLLGQVRQVHHRIDHEIDGHEVDVAALDAEQRHPARPRFAQLLQGLEEVVGPIDLVGKSGLGMAEHDARTVNAKRQLAVRSHHRFRIVLGAMVGMIEFFRFLEHVLREGAAIKPGRRNRAHQMEAACVDRRGEIERALGARDVRLFHELGAGIDIVDRAQVIEVLDLALELRGVGLANAQSRLRKVALDGHDSAYAVLAPELAQLVELAHGFRPHQHVDRAFTALQ